jgi:hypothetical protein
MVRQVNVIMRTRSIKISSWDKSMQELGVSKDITERLRGKHMRRLLEKHEYVLQSYRVCTGLATNKEESTLREIGG